MFKKNLLSIKNDLKLHKRDKNTLIRFYINKRLNDSLTSYYKTLESSAYALSVSNPEKVIKEI